MPRGRPRTKPVRTTPKRAYKKSGFFKRDYLSEQKLKRQGIREARRAERALLALNKPPKRKYTRREKTAANAMLTL